MQIKQILEEKTNELLSRKEVKVIVEASKNPAVDEAINLLAEKFKTEKDNIAVKLIKGKFGRNTFLINAFVYKSKEDKEKIEPKKKAKKGTEQISAETAQTPATPVQSTQATAQEQKK